MSRPGRDSDIPGLFGVALPSATRTATTQSPDLFCGGRGLMVIINVTAASGTGGLTLQLLTKDGVSGVYVRLTNPIGTVQSVNGPRVYLFYPFGATPGSPGDLWGFATTVVPATFALSVVHADASAYTYSLSYQVLP